MEATNLRELISDLEAFVLKAQDETMGKPGVKVDKQTKLVGTCSKYQDYSSVGECSVFIGDNYFTIEICRGGFRFCANSTKYGVKVDQCSLLAYLEHRDEILDIWEIATSRARLSEDEQEREFLMEVRERKLTQIRALEQHIERLTIKIKNTSSL